MKEQLRRYEKRIFDLKQLLEISRALNSTLDYHYLVQAILDMCLAQAQTIHAGLYLTPEMDSRYIIPVSSSKEVTLTQKEDSQINLNDPFMHALETRYPTLSLAKAKQLFPENKHIMTLERTGADILIAMKIRNKIIGFIFLGEKITGENYSEEECSFFEDLSTLSAIAVYNAHLYERATTDKMTKLKNYAYFHSFLHEERERAIKRRYSLCLLFIDIDRFKNFNDTYGHQAGDVILKRVANILKTITRKKDFAARYGGEEFCIIMPQVEIEAAKKTAERMRLEIEKLQLKYEQHTLQVTISIGLAMFDPEIDAERNTYFIERADKALYFCKRNGRNQVKVYDPSMSEKMTSPALPAQSGESH